MSIGTKLVCAPALLAELGARNPFDGPLTEAGRIGGNLLFERIGGKRRQRRATAGQHAKDRSERGAAGDGWHRHCQVGTRRHKVAYLGIDEVAALRLFEIVDHLRDAEESDGNWHEPDPVCKLRKAEHHTRHTRIDVDADEAKQHAEDDHDDGLRGRPVRQHHRADETQNDQAHRLDRRELQGEECERHAHQGDGQRGKGTGNERADTGDGERRPGASLPRHLVAVDARDDRRGLARHVDENGRRRAAVLRSVEDPGQHDERGSWRQTERERQQHRHRRQRRYSRQHADERADDHADKAEGQVRGCCRRRKTERKVGEKIHVRALTKAKVSRAGQGL